MSTPSEHTPLVTLLMAVHNAGPYLEKALQSVLGQSLTSWQLVCVDDASTDASPLILQRYARTDCRITVIRKAVNEGQAVARNEALQHARGEFITMLDADDWLSPDALQLAVDAFSGQTDCVVLRLMQHYEDDGREELYPIPFETGTAVSGYEAFVASLDWRLHGLYVVRRDIHLRYPYDTSCRLFSDDNTTRLHYLHSREVRFCQGTYHYRKHAASCTNAITPDRFLYMQANLSMRQALLREQVSPDIIRLYERYRWLNYIGQLWLFACHRHELDSQSRQRIRDDFRRIHATFQERPVPVKFGYTWFRSYRLFLLQEKIYFALRRLLGRDIA